MIPTSGEFAVYFWVTSRDESNSDKIADYEDPADTGGMLLEQNDGIVCIRWEYL